MTKDLLFRIFPVILLLVSTDISNSEVANNDDLFKSEQLSIEQFQQQAHQNNVSTSDLEKLYGTLTEKQRIISGFNSPANPYHALKVSNVLVLTQRYNELRDNLWKTIEERKSNKNSDQEELRQAQDSGYIERDNSFDIGMTTERPTNGKWADLSKIVAKLRDLDGSYGDVPSRINCYKPRNHAQTLICTDTYLTIAELFYSRYSVYEWENGTKREVDHKGFKVRLPDECADKQCIYDFFSDAAYQDLGENSPYFQPVADFTGHFLGRGDGNLDLTVRKTDKGFKTDVTTSIKNKCSGAVSGLARKTSGDTLKLTARAPGDEKQCLIVMVYKRDKITMSSQNCSALHGAECDFVGELAKK